MRRKKVTILGSTGSVGLNAVAVLRELAEEFELVSVSGHRQWQVLAEQSREFGLAKAALTDGRYERELKEALAGSGTEVLVGAGCLEELVADEECDIVIVSVVGSAALPAVRAAIAAGKTVAIANKESLVMAGCLLMPLAKETGAKILPIDSEHSAILQAMQAGNRDEIEKIIITASGGPFREWPAEAMAAATVKQALNHPTWDMGPKITIDSATMMNKALEIIEARWLFDLGAEKMEVLIHPESIIHSMVQFCDGSVIAQMSEPDMRLPIQYALTYPRRMCQKSKRLQLSELRELHFEAPDVERFGAIRLGFEAARRGGTYGAVLNAANEEAVQAFRQEVLGFSEITRIVEDCLDAHDSIEKPSMEDIFAADEWARQEAKKRIGLFEKEFLPRMNTNFHE